MSGCQLYRGGGGTSPLPKINITRTTIKVGPKTQGSNNSLVPKVHNNVTNAKVSNTSCRSNNQITLSGSQYEPSVGCEDTIVPTALFEAPSPEMLYKNHCLDKDKWEKVLIMTKMKTSQRNTNNPPLSPLEAHNRIKNTGLPNFMHY